jgi:hypothetical protein
MAKVFVGHDWAEDHHDVLIVDDSGRRLAGGRLSEGVDGIGRFHEMLGGLADDPAEVVIATETDRGLFVNTLVAAGYTVIAVNPMSTSRYRERHSTSGAKSDPGMRRSSLTLPGPTPTTTVRSLGTVTWVRRSRCSRERISR